MIAQLKIKNYDSFLFSKLSDKHYNCKKVKDALIVELKDFEIIGNTISYEIPRAVLQYEYSFEVCEYESGGRNGEFGEATIICSEIGKRVKPLFIFKELRPNDKHAYFVLNDEFIIIKSYCPGSKVIIQKYSCAISFNKAIITIKEYFNGEIDNIRGVLKEVANLAYLKACTVDCKEVVFAKKDEIL